MNMLENFEIEIASIPTQENLVAEIFYGVDQWVQIYFQKDELFIQFYPPSNSQYWEFPYDLSIQILEKAKKRLLEVEFGKR
jgi:hypothetical protein